MLFTFNNFVKNYIQFLKIETTYLIWPFLKPMRSGVPNQFNGQGLPSFLYEDIECQRSENSKFPVMASTNRNLSQLMDWCSGKDVFHVSPFRMRICLMLVIPIQKLYPVSRLGSVRLITVCVKLNQLLK